jgi:hypothetical protein
MKLSDYLAMPNNAHKEQGNPGVEVNALYKTGNNFNCYLTATQAMNLAENLLKKARLIQEEGIDDAIVHLWNQGLQEETRTRANMCLPMLASSC